MTEPIEIDADMENADWTKTSWDLPPYKSKEFFQLMGDDVDLDWFRTTQTYKAAVEALLIHDDEWVGDYVEDPEPLATPIKRRGIHIHYHKD